MHGVDHSPLLGILNPYPGLRPFEAHESFLFHGREEHTRALLERLSVERFLAVVGSSGSGKSSLVRAGLLPALYRGYLVGASSRWRIAVMRPGSAPIDELARALAAPEALGLPLAEVRATVGATSRGLVTAVQRASLADGENVLLVVDQFEELFRFERERRHQDGGAEASLFVQSLIEAAGAYNARLFVVITMRSDYLGQCAQFAGLPEALNRGQYLIPHLTREERRQAIEKPPLVAGVRMKPALAQQLLNDMGDDPAQLPVLQHALMRTFRCLREANAPELDFEHYRRAGGLASALDLHANAIVAQLPEPSRRWVEKIFRTLTTMEGTRAVRRPARLDRIFEVLGAGADRDARAEIATAIEAFVRPENSLLVSSTGPELRGESVIDISHESLIRNWHELRRWLAEETRSAEWFRSVVDDTVRYRTGEAGLWRDPELSRVLQLRGDAGWNETWARQYMPKLDPPYTEVERFLEQSVRAQQAEQAEKEAKRRKEIEDARALALAAARAKKFYRLFAWTLVLLFIAAGGWGLMWFRQHQQESEAARTSVDLANQIYEKTLEQARLQEELRKLQAQLEGAEQGGSAEALRRQVRDLQQQLTRGSVQVDSTRQELQKSTAAAGSDYAQALRRVADLQAELNEVRTERNELRDRLDTMSTLQVRDAGYWRSRFEAADAENRLLRSAASGAFAEPIVLALPQYSVLRLDAAPFFGNVFLFIEDLGRARNSTATLFVVKPNRAGALTEFADNERAAARLGAALRSRVKCPAYGSDGQGEIWCFNVDKDTTLADTQRLGRFQYQSGVFSVVATGWAQNVRKGGTDVLTLVIHQLRPAARK